jgi:hypothetical protein
MWNKTEDRKVTETKMTMCMTREKKIDLQVGYRKKDREVKHSVRPNLSKWICWFGKEMQLQMRVISGNISSYMKFVAKEDSKELTSRSQKRGYCL